jgi:hypothetical protein
MNKHLISIGVVIILLAVGLSGCNEISNDDKEFLVVADTIIDDICPVSSYNIYLADSKATQYTIKIAEYTLSSKCDKIREYMYSAFETIEFTNDNSYYLEPEQVREMYEVINSYFSLARDDIRELQG